MKKMEAYGKCERQQRGLQESYFSAMRRRLSLQSISAYIRDGGDQLVEHNQSFRQREAEAFSKLKCFMVEECGAETDKVMDQVNAYAFVIQEIYFNLGMKAGAILEAKLTGNFETDL